MGQVREGDVDRLDIVANERWAYLGPVGTFTEQAAADLAARHAGDSSNLADRHAGDTLDLADRHVGKAPELVPAASVPAALAEVRAGRADAACVPLESSVEGAVPLTHDELTHGEPLLITAEAYVPVTFQLLARPGMTLSAIRTVGSHPHGIAQVRDWLATHLPQATTEVTGSTAAAAAAVADGVIDAAASAPVAGVRYGLTALADDIGLVHDAVTRFVLLRRPTAPPAPTGNDRTSMVLWVANEPGTLLALLTEFSARGVNLTRLESRPTRTRAGEYVFLVDADGHVTDPAVADVLGALLRRGALLRYLGSYPRMSGHSISPVAAGAQGDYTRSSAVVADLQRGVLSAELSAPDGEAPGVLGGTGSRGGWGPA